MTKNFFISGTDTDVGKTIISSILVKKLKASYYKPIQCGLDKNKKKDSEIIQALSGGSKIYKETYFFKSPVSPYVASILEKKKISITEILKIKKKISENLIIEGAGGLYVPITQKFLMIDLIKKFNFPLILVCRTKVGTINHTLMSLEIIKKKQINLFGLIFVGENFKESTQAIKYFGKKILKKNIKIIGKISLNKKITKTKINLLANEINI